MPSSHGETAKGTADLAVSEVRDEACLLDRDQDIAARREVTEVAAVETAEAFDKKGPAERVMHRSEPTAGLRGADLLQESEFSESFRHACPSSGRFFPSTSERRT